MELDVGSFEARAVAAEKALQEIMARVSALEGKEPTVKEPSCLFCKIVAKEIPCYKIYEDEHTLAFLDLFPCTPGHALVIPKSHYATLDKATPASAQKLMLSMTKVGQAIMKLPGVEGFNTLQNNYEAAGQVVHHVHFHVIPRRAGDELLEHPAPKGQLSASDAKPTQDALSSFL